MSRWLQDVFDVPLVIQLTGNSTLYYFLDNFSDRIIRRREVPLQA